MTGKSFEGHHSGRTSKSLLTEDEEKYIANRIIEKINGDQILSSAIVREIFREELEVIKVNFPERTERIQKLMDHKGYCIDFARRFALRHNLKKYFPEDTRERPYECDVCLKRFTFKNTLVKHTKVVHYSFLHQDAKW